MYGSDSILTQNRSCAFIVQPDSRVTPILGLSVWLYVCLQTNLVCNLMCTRYSVCIWYPLAFGQALSGDIVTLTLADPPALPNEAHDVS